MDAVISRLDATHISEGSSLRCLVAAGKWKELLTRLTEGECPSRRAIWRGLRSAGVFQCLVCHRHDFDSETSLKRHIKGEKHMLHRSDWSKSKDRFLGEYDQQGPLVKALSDLPPKAKSTCAMFIMQEGFFTKF